MGSRAPLSGTSRLTPIVQAFTGHISGREGGMPMQWSWEEAWTPNPTPSMA